MRAEPNKQKNDVPSVMDAASSKKSSFFHKKTKGELHKDIPLWGLLSFASAVFLFGINIKSMFIVIVFPLLILLSIWVKSRINLSRNIELIAPLILAVIFVVIYQGGQPLQSLNYVSGINILIYLLTVWLYFMILAMVYKVKKTNEIYLAYISSAIILLFSFLYSPWRIDMFNSTVFINIAVFLIYGLSSCLFYLDMMFLSSKIVKTETPFAKAKVLWLYLIIPLVIFLSLGAGQLIKSHEYLAVYFVMDKFRARPPVTGFSNNAMLGIMENMAESDKIVLRIYSTEPMHKIKGRTYNTYKNGRWEADAQRKSLTPMKSYPKELREALKDQSLTIFSAPEIVINNMPEKGFGSQLYYVFMPANINLFLPETPAAAAVNLSSLYEDSLGSLFSSLNSIDYYEMITLNPSEYYELKETDKPGRGDTIIPKELWHDFNKIAVDAAGGLETEAGRAYAIEKYLKENYNYQLGIRLTERNMDPVHEFLLFKRDAHCEYFASAMTLLLRSIDIPARYVTGLVVHEYNSAGGYYIVRERDAHAWVEVFDYNHGWVEFEPTPFAGLPQNVFKHKDNLWDHYFFFIQRIYRYLKAGSFQKLAELIYNRLALLTLKDISAILFFIIIFLSWFKRKEIVFFLKQRQKQKVSDKNTIENRLLSLLNVFDKKLEKAGIYRPRHLTLTEYFEYIKVQGVQGENLELCSQFINQYAKLRYACDENNENHEKSTELLVDILNRMVL